MSGTVAVPEVNGRPSEPITSALEYDRAAVISGPGRLCTVALV